MKKHQSKQRKPKNGKKSNYKSRMGLSWTLAATKYYALAKANKRVKNDAIDEINEIFNEEKITGYKRVEFPSIVLSVIIAMIDSNRSKDFSYFGGNSHISDRIYKKTGVLLKSCEIIKILQRIAKTGILSIVYNPNLKLYSVSRYDDYDDGEVTERPGVFVDYNSPKYRLIKLNMDMLQKVLGAVDDNDPFIRSLPARSFLRKYYKRKPVVMMECVSKEFKNIKARAKQNIKALRTDATAKLADSYAAFTLFLQNNSSKFFDISNNYFIKNQHTIFANDSTKGNLVPPDIADDDTGAILTHKDELILNEGYANIQTSWAY